MGSMGRGASESRVAVSVVAFTFRSGEQSCACIRQLQANDGNQSCVVLACLSSSTQAPRDSYGTNIFGSNLPARKRSPNTAIRWSTNDIVWGSATVRDELANEYFARQANSLEQQGFCIMDGFMSDKDIPKELFELPSCGVNCDVLEEISNLLLYSFLGEEALKDEANRSVRNPIVNVGERDEYDCEKGFGRFITTIQAFTTKMETESTWVAVRRALLDVRIGQMRTAMRVGNGMDGNI